MKFHYDENFNANSEVLYSLDETMKKNISR